MKIIQSIYQGNEMKKLYRIVLPFFSAVFLLSACGKEKEPDYSEYISAINPIFENITAMDSKISDIDANDEESFTQLLSYIDEMALLYEELSLIEPPDEFMRTKSLASESYDYLLQSKVYLSEAFANNEINQAKLDNGIECYNRANKRLHYIIKILHNELIVE